MPNIENCIYKNEYFSVEDRVKDLLSKMTLDEKIAQMNMKPFGGFYGDDKVFSDHLANNLAGGIGIGAIDTTAAFANAISEKALNAEEIADMANKLQSYLINNTRLGIPAFIVGEGLHGLLLTGATVYPQSIGIGCSFHRDLIRKMSRAVAKEAKLTGFNQLNSPNLDIARDPRWGRVEETYGEDPYLIGEFGVEYVNGLQGTEEKLGDENVVATMKHFIAHGDPQGGLNLAPVAGGDRLLRELYLKPYKKVIDKTNVLSVMQAYSEYDGVPITASKYLLTDLLRQELGFKGYMISDYTAVSMLHRFHKIAKTPEEAGQFAINAGMDLEAPESFGYGEGFKELVKNGTIHMEFIDKAVCHILRAKFLAGLFDNPYVDVAKVKEIFNCKEHKDLAYEIASESIVLLKNNNMLPLNKDKKTIAVIGPNGDRVQLGDYSSTKPDALTLFKALELEKGSEIEILYSEGCDIHTQDQSKLNTAVETAKKADVIIFAGGETSLSLCGVGWGSDEGSASPLCGEGYDRNELGLPGVQEQLFDELKKLNKPIITVLMNGRPLTIGNIADSSEAVIEAWYPGEEGGRALADIIFGNVNPSGKLCISFPKNIGQIPVYYNHKPSARGSFYKKPGSLEKAGRDYVFDDTNALFNFGFGLSYTSFEYSDLKLSKDVINKYENVQVRVKVKNTGKMKGKEAVLLFVNDLFSSVTTPVKSLCGFEKIELNPGEEKAVIFNIDKEHLLIIDINLKETVESGEFAFMCGNMEVLLTVE